MIIISIYQCKNLVGKAPIAEKPEEEVAESEEEGEGEESEENSELRTLVANLVKEQLEQSLEGYQRDLEESRRQLEEEESNEEGGEIFPASPVLPHIPTPPATATFSVSGLAAKVNSLQEVVDGHQKKIEYLEELISSSGTAPQVKKTVERFDLQNQGFEYMFDKAGNKFLVNKEKV